ncbi:methyl-accepting chemotaxis protein [Deinococcus depolymerans]|uniref:HAMP domain-containing methyl-accepting chemotaxis protein n=1 Tax=Deinococcus depolymerans TaxID=392408 RepID=A0ABN1CA24_9DEIO
MTHSKELLMSIRLKLIGVLLLLVVPLALTGVISVAALRHSGEVSAELTRGLQQARVLTNLRGAVNRLALLTAEDLLLRPGRPETGALEAVRAEAATQLAEAPNSPALSSVRRDWAALETQLDALLRVADTQPAAAVARFEQRLQPARAQLVSSVNAYLDAREAALSAEQLKLTADLTRSQRIVTWTALLGGVLGLACAWLVLGRIVAAVLVVARASRRLSEGYLDDLPAATSGDEIGQMLGALGALGQQQRQLAQALGELSRGSSQVTFPVRHAQDVVGHAVRDLTRHTEEVAASARALAAGDLRTQLPVRSEQDTLGLALRDMLAQLRAFALQNQEFSAQLALSSQSLVAATTQQATSVNQQSAAIAETTAAVEEVRTSSRHAVEVAGSVTRQAEEARSVAAQGVQAAQAAEQGMVALQGRVDDIAQNMLHLSRHSRQISEIIETVADIADQSNLLALNAAIEANRAGEQGRGFAVVAQEIRTLAEQSKGATQQIRRMLEDVQQATNAAVLATEEGSKQAQVGTALIDRAGRTIQALSGVNEDAARMTAQISESVQQHALSMEQIAIAMHDINEATLQHLNVTQDNQQVARHLQALVEQLNGLTARYHT